jgi:RNA polymerase sigma-70 factor (ECF subfamily)
VDTVSLEEAYRRWADSLVAFASTLTGRDEAADAVADVFQRLLADPAVWASVREPRSYLFRCVANAARASGRSTSRREARERAVWSTTVRTADANAEPAGAILVDQRIGRAVAALSAQQRAVVFLTYWMDEPVEGVAEILAVRPGTVRRQLARARHRLRGVLA